MNREAPARTIWGEKAGPVVLTHLPTPDHTNGVTLIWLLTL